MRPGRANLCGVSCSVQTGQRGARLGGSEENCRAARGGSSLVPHSLAPEPGPVLRVRRGAVAQERRAPAGHRQTQVAELGYQVLLLLAPDESGQGLV